MALTQPVSEPKMYLNVWNAQRIVYELIINHFLTNDPAKLGYSFDQRYSADEKKSKIYISNAFFWNAGVVNKRPAIFVSRQDMVYNPVQFIGQNFSVNPRNSQEKRLRMSSLPLKVSIIASPVGLAESIADYVKYPLLYNALEIKRDFNLRQFALRAISTPRQFPESRDNFQIDMMISMVFDENWEVTKDSLKIKTISYDIFNSITQGTGYKATVPPPEEFLPLWNPDIKGFCELQIRGLPPAETIEVSPPVPKPQGILVYNADTGKDCRLIARGLAWPYSLQIQDVD